MPTYEYRCSSCHHHYELRQGFDAPSENECPTCGGTARRVLHAPPIVFKGSGFYVTDSRKRSWSDGDGGSNGTSASEDAKDTTAAAAG